MKGLKVNQLVSFVIILLGTVGSFIFIDPIKMTVMGLICLLCSIGAFFIVVYYVVKNWDEYIIRL